MTEAEAARIESEIGRSLPKDDRQTLLEYPMVGQQGNSDSPLFDDARAIIDLTKRYQAGFAGMKPWPQHYLFIGDDGAASCYVLDLASSPEKVLFLDHGNPDCAKLEAPSLLQFVRRSQEDLHPDGKKRFSPPTRRERLFGIPCLGFVGLLALAIIGKLVLKAIGVLH